MSRNEEQHRRARRLDGTFHETLDLHRLLVDAVRDYAIFALDTEGYILTWNAGAERLKGYTADEIIGQHFSIFYPERAVATRHPWNELEVAKATGSYEETGWRIRKDGTRFWANVLITAVRDSGGQLLGFTKVTRDLTERKEAEDALRESEQRFRLMVQSVTDYGIFMLDPDGYVVSWNEGAERIKGYTEEEIVGQHFSMFYPAEDVEAGKPARELQVAREVGRLEDEGWRLRKDGTRFWANVIITRLTDASGKLIGFGKVTRDLTARREAELEKLEDTRRVAEAEAANRAKSEFLTAMSHELRTPLNAIGGYVDLMSYGVHGPLTGEQETALERIRTSQGHLLSLINDLLNFSQIEAGRLTYAEERVPLADVVGDVRSMVEMQAADRGLSVAVREPDRPVVAVADRSRIQQILLNLLSNAVKFTPSGGRVDISMDRRGDRAVIDVADDGVGIPQDQLERIFEPFVQVGRSLTSAHEGTGLGLAISRDLARAMGGELTVDSRAGQGSTFTLLLPLAEE